jgi:hypothetical protein
MAIMQMSLSQKEIAGLNRMIGNLLMVRYAHGPSYEKAVAEVLSDATVQSGLKGTQLSTFESKLKVLIKGV